ncbi:MAG TPA: SDR family oxidoreductase [Xanthobacteraceae bacterium]|nr:SDR family oxidoreductase [Xanthobacteraceae bacterium]
MPTEARPKLAIITGASRGLGRNTALNLARRGVDVILTYHSNRAEADAAVAEIEALGRKAKAFALDTGNVAAFDVFAADVARALNEIWGRDRFDYLVNNAGIGVNAPFSATKEADFDRLCDVHFKGVFFLTQKLLPLIADGGRIINLSSGVVRFAAPGYSAYAAMKDAIEVLTRYLAKELGPRRIAVNAVAPGATETDFAGGLIRKPEYNERVASVTAMGRVGVPDDIGPAIASLLSDEYRWMTGQRIEVSGGQQL